MNRRVILNIILKVFGIQLVVAALVYVPQLISTASLYVSDNWTDVIGFLLGIALSAVVYLLASFALIFRTEKILDRILRDETFEENEFASLKIHRSTVLSICIIVIGGLLVINTLPNFIYNSYLQTQQEKFSILPSTKTNMAYVIFDGVKIFLGICMVAYQKTIVLWIDRRRKS